MSFREALKKASTGYVSLAMMRNSAEVCLMAALDSLAEDGYPCVEKKAIIDAYNDLDDRRMDAALKGVTHDKPEAPTDHRRRGA